MTVQLEASIPDWAIDLVNGLYLNRGYRKDLISEVMDRQAEGWGRFLIRHRLTEDKVLAETLVIEFGERKVEGNIYRLFEQVASFVAARPALITEKNEQLQSTHVECTICEGAGCVMIPMPKGMCCFACECFNGRARYSGLPSVTDEMVQRVYRNRKKENAEAIKWMAERKIPPGCTFSEFWAILKKRPHKSPVQGVSKSVV